MLRHCHILHPWATCGILYREAPLPAIRISPWQPCPGACDTVALHSQVTVSRHPQPVKGIIQNFCRRVQRPGQITCDAASARETATHVSRPRDASYVTRGRGASTSAGRRKICVAGGGRREPAEKPSGRHKHNGGRIASSALPRAAAARGPGQALVPTRERPGTPLSARADRRSS